MVSARNTSSDCILTAFLEIVMILSRFLEKVPIVKNKYTFF